MNPVVLRIVEKYRWRPEFDKLAEIGVRSHGCDGDGLIHLAAWDGALNDVLALIDAGADPNMIGDIGNTPLQYAAMKGHDEVVRLLLEKGADPSIVNAFGDTAQSWATSRGHPQTARLIARWQGRAGFNGRTRT